jgi:hypothetical protein
MRCVTFGRLAAPWIVGLVLTACTGVQPGDPCRGPMAPCGNGMVCERVDSRWAFRCLLGCEGRSDCPGGSACIAISSSLVTETRGVCDTWGTRGAGESCLEEYFAEQEDPCGPGLACNGMGSPVCVPACDSLSPHSEDRACPEGMICNAQVSRGISTTQVCLRRCDLTSPTGCGQFEACIRFAHPEEGEIGVCRDPGFFACDCPAPPCFACPPGQLCVGPVCYDSPDAPAIPWPISPDVPPLVD